MASFHSLCRRANAHLWDPQRSEEKNGGSSLRLLAPKLSGDETGKTHVQLHLQEAAGNEEEAKKVQKCYSLHVSYIEFFLLKILILVPMLMNRKQVLFCGSFNRSSVNYSGSPIEAQI